MNKIKYDADYISYVESGESAAVFVARDIVRSIDTSGMWIDILNLKGDKNDDDRWDFKHFTMELFPRRKYPKYPDGISDEDKKYITWKTAHEDILEQRSRGYKGTKFRIIPKLVNRNQGKYRKIPYEPKWDYNILAIKRL
ncbi:MAG: hypothetical protein K2K46_07090 [Lachnospiraceae bacterium]|nr:hypothetical protein [Lachnospiraceae bacterium]